MCLGAAASPVHNQSVGNICVVALLRHGTVSARQPAPRSAQESGNADVNVRQRGKTSAQQTARL